MLIHKEKHNSIYIFLCCKIKIYIHNISINLYLYILGCLGFAIICLFVIQFFPVILDFISPLNEPRLLKCIITVEYFISQDNYIYIVILHEVIILSLFSLILTATGTQMLLLAHHSLGMFKIVR